MQLGALRARVASVLRRGQGLPPLSPHPFLRTPFSASGILPSLRSGQVSLDEAEHFTAQSSCQRRYAPMVFGIIPECRSASFRNERSASPESPVNGVSRDLSTPEAKLPTIRLQARVAVIRALYEWRVIRSQSGRLTSIHAPFRR